MFLQDFELRTIVALGLRLIATEIVPVDSEAFDHYVDVLAERAAAALQTQGLSAVPPFPGARLGQPLAGDGRGRAIFSADLWRENVIVGTAMTSLIGGRLPNINVAPPIDPPAPPRSARHS